MRETALQKALVVLLPSARRPRVLPDRWEPQAFAFLLEHPEVAPRRNDTVVEIAELCGLRRNLLDLTGALLTCLGTTYASRLTSSWTCVNLKTQFS